MKLFFITTFLLLFLKISYQMDFVVFKNQVKDHAWHTIFKREIDKSNIPKIRAFVVKTTVANRYAETNVVSHVENVDKIPKQTTFSVVLPDRAYISGFSMEIEGTIYKAFVLEKKEAEKVFTQSLSSGQTAAHVAVSARNSNRFTINVNIEPETKVVFHLVYEELLQRENGYYEIITNIQPGQLVKNLMVEIEINESQPLLFVRIPALRSGKVQVQNSANLDPQAMMEIRENSALIKFNPDINHQLNFACAGLGNKHYDGFAGQFVVQYEIKRDERGSETLVQDGFFINFFAPINLPPIPKHIVFVLDTSGSMEGSKIAQLKDAMLNILPQLHSDDLFNIVQYESTVYLWNSDLTNIEILPKNPQYGNLASQIEAGKIQDTLFATKENIEKAQNIMKQFVADGLTNCIGGLEIGLYLVRLVQKRYQGKFKPFLVFLTDGHPNNGISDTSKIISLISDINSRQYKTPIFSLAFGTNTNWKFLEQLSLSNYAKPTLIDAASDASSQLQDFYRKISNPVLSDIKYNNLPPAAQLTRVNFPFYFDGSELITAGRGIPTNISKSITVSAQGRNGTVELEAKIGVPLTRLERLWAYLTVKQLLDQYYATSSLDEKTILAKSALDVALEYSLVTDVTSLIVIKPNTTDKYINPEDALQGIIPEPPNELPMCKNITDWISKNFGTFEPTTTTTEHFTEETIIYFGVDPMSKRISKCHQTSYGCCHDGITEAIGENYLGCDPIPNSNSCSLPQDKGSCTDITYKWYYSNREGKCVRFSYGGCGGNANRFASKEICEKYCIDVEGPDKCNLAIHLGQGTNYKIKWFYDKNRNECVKLLYFGCTGNSNRFETKEECKQQCCFNNKNSKAQDVCSLPRDKGICEQREPKFYYDLEKGNCEIFLYGGCGGNDNRFNNRDECENVCIKPKDRDICNLPAVTGPCAQYGTKWYFDKSRNGCLQFTYGGCLGNMNRFDTREQCYSSCFENPRANLKRECYFNLDVGPCKNYDLQWFYDIKSGRCKQFWYGGCGGNENRFNSEPICKYTCVHPVEN